MKEQDNLPIGQNGSAESAPVKKSGGLYRNVKVSMKTVNIVIIIGIIALFASAFFMVRHNGFIVDFDTNGGSYVQSCKVMYGELIDPPENPVKEGWNFSGWYYDRDCTAEWDMKSDKVTDSFTLYAGWTPKSGSQAP